MTHNPSPAEELRVLDTELWQLDARRAQLLARRVRLVAALDAARPAQPFAAPFTPPRPEAPGPRVQNVLLVLGGVLFTIAATAFTLVSWGHLGIAGRALVLGAITAAALCAPVPLLGRGLRSTAESVAGLGLALTVLDAYALHEVALAGVDGVGYTAAATATLAALWTAYGLLPRVGELRLPLPAALAAAQLPLLLWAVAAGAGPYLTTAALLVTAGFDTGVALRVPVRSVRLAATVGAYGMGAWGALTAGGLSWTATGPSAAARAAALLLLAAAIALTAARLTAHPRTSALTAPAGGLLLVAAFGGMLRVVLPDVWTVPAHLACGVALFAATRLSEPLRRGLLLASAGVQALTLLWTVPLVAVTLLGPVAWVERAWSGTPSDIRAAVTVDAPWPPRMETVPVVLAAVAAVLALAVRDTTWRPRALTGALTLTWAALLTLPAVLELPYAVGLSALVVTTAAALATAALLRPSADAEKEPEPGAAPAFPFPTAQPTALVLALLSSLTLAFLSLAAQTATLAVLSVLTALFAAASVRSAPVTAPAALAYAAALACAVGAAANWPTQHTALLVLTVPVAAALLAARFTGGSRATLPVEVAGAAAGLLAVGLAVTDLPMLALVLSLCGVITAGTAVRPDRRPVAYASIALFALATWVRLAAWEVTTPEAYTLPVTVPALIVGALRRRRDPQASSWTAYGPGLAATLVPSLAAAWGDPGWTRPLLLGLAALTVTLLGARHHLQAPLLLGGAVLALDALHELAPYLIQIAGALPRWVPPALAGLLLLALGATYEQRIRDAHRVRDMLGKLH
ncbi:hypothetical protein AB0I00_14420 [Streptomyces sp. NPDC050803]|uniref:SCO7613 C-terminal domain-containing membrane protein n=1 Tax=unclassified Streptomyces TaxID=2593676 RepID=UPI0034302CCD